ncbi:androglobin-like isoform X7 [Bolinopsis microptera]|uniref:androglobin-like isoform X7 n=1 Tax=Bolinopsis microptera TaxID=2820187 RepID=UPI00307A5C80
MGKNSRERITSSTPTLQKEVGESETVPVLKFLSGNNRLNIWPEWDDASLANEKWDVPAKGKSDRAARTPGTLFEDPEGLVLLPASLKVDTWRRPGDYLGDKVDNSQAQTVVEDPDQTCRLNILIPNQGIFKQSELVRSIITQISLLYQTEAPCAPGLRTDGNVSGSDVWKPWHHLYPRSKPPNSFPVHSASGKYAVKLFWMGIWRKIIVDDQIPFDAEGKCLLPQCDNESELWLPILSKAIIKVASLDFQSGYPDREFSEVSVIQMLTGWMPEVIDVKNRGKEDIWNLIDSSIPTWTEEQPPSDTTSVHSTAQSVISNVPTANPTAKEPALIFGSYDIGFNGDEPIGVPEIKAEVGGTSFSGLPPPMIWLTETRKTAIPPPKPTPFMVADPSTQLRPTEALFQLRQQRQQRIKHELLLKELAATSPKLIHATSAFPNFEEVLGDYVPDTCASQARSVSKKKEPEKKPDKKKPENAKSNKDGSEKNKPEKKKEDKKKSTDDKSEKAEKKKEKKKTPDQSQQEIPPETSSPCDEELAEEEEIPAVSPLVSFWIEFNQFFGSFSKLYVFHKANSYSCHRSVSDMRNVSPSSMIVPTGGRRTAAGQSGAVTSATHLRGIPAPSPIPATGSVPQHNHSLLQGQPGEIQPPLIICLDSTDPIEVLVSFTSLSHWHDAPIIINPTLGPVFTSDNKLGYSAAEVVEQNSNPESDHTIVVPGRLELSNYMWNEIRATLEVISTMETTATKTCRLTLPAGLHTLRLSVAAPYAWHADFVSNTPFVIADTESFVNHVNRESLRYQAAALRLMKMVGESVENFGDPEDVGKTVQEIACADKGRDKDLVFPDIKAFFESLFHMLEKTLGDQITSQHREAWTTFSTTVVRAYKIGNGENLFGIFETDPVPFKKQMEPSEVFDTPGEKEEEEKKFTEKDEKAAKTIQKHFKGHHVRKRTRAVQKGTKVNLSTKGALQDSWGKLEGDELQHGLNILKKMFTLKPDLLDQYSFKEDMEKCAYYVDHHGNHGDIPARNWFLLFRETFTATREAMVTVSVTAGVSGLLLRIIDNDTGKEIPTICNRPKPYLFKPNKIGYTFLCEGKTLEGALAGGKYRLRMVGNSPELLTPVRDIASSGVETNDIKEYYTPERHNIMFRYAVNVLADTPATVQVSTSKSDVNFRVEIFDGEDQLFKQEGIGHIVVPCLTFYTDEDSSSKGRRTPQKTRRSVGAKSGTKSPGRTKTPVAADPDAAPRKKSHRYIVQATVLRDSWNNNESPWQSILDQILPKDSDADRPTSGSIAEEKPSTPNKKRGAREEKSNPKNAAKPGQKAPSPAFDESKPYWLLRVCADAGEEVTLKRDTQREDEIKSIKATWEELQPGRAAKAKALREKYLARKAEEAEKEAKEKAEKEGEEKVEEKPKVEERLSIGDGAEAEATKDEHSGTVTFSVSEMRPPSPKFYQIPPPFQPYVKGDYDDVLLFDDEENLRHLDEHREKVEEFHDGRKNVLDGRMENRAHRNDLKEQLLLTAENMQVEVDSLREEMFSLRDTLRQKQLAEEAARIAAMEPEQVTTPSPKPPSAKKPKSPKGAKKGKK